MSNMEELRDLMVELLDSNVTATPEQLTVTERGREIINEIADYAEKTAIFQKEKGRGEWVNGKTAVQIYGHMLERVVHAPTTIHRDMSILLIMPFLRQKLQEDDHGK